MANKVAIVVGAGQTPGMSTGNGRATAVLFAQEGARVLVADQNLPSAEETAEQIRAAGGAALAVRADVTRESDLEAMVEACVDSWGRIDVLHNNVGVGPLAGDASILEITSEAFMRVVAINLQGMVLTSKHVLPVMREQRAGSIVNIASVAVLIEYPHIAYQTSKAGVVKLTEHLAITNASFGIRANTILPGLMATPMAVEHKIGGSSGMSRDDVVAERIQRVPLRRSGTAWDVARAAVFLASDEAGFVTGTSLIVDGGQHLVAG